MDLVKKYKINDHLDNLEDRYGKKKFHHDQAFPDDTRLEDVCSPFDEDYLAILQFRQECNERDQRRLELARMQFGSSRNIVKVDLDQIADGLKRGYSVSRIAHRMHMSPRTVQRRIRDNRRLYTLWQYGEEC